MADLSFARPQHMLGADPVLGNIPVAGKPSGGQGLTLEPNGTIPASLQSSPVTGQVGSGATIVAGSGWTVASGGTGLYTITFNSAFVAAPTVVATAFDATGSRVAHIVSVATTNVVIQIRQGGGTTSNNDFHFVAYTTV